MKKVLGLCVAIGGLMKRCHVLPTWIEFRPSHIWAHGFRRWGDRSPQGINHTAINFIPFNHLFSQFSTYHDTIPTLVEKALGDRGQRCIAVHIDHSSDTRRAAKEPRRTQSRLALIQSSRKTLSLSLSKVLIRLFWYFCESHAFSKGRYVRTAVSISLHFEHFTPSAGLCRQGGSTHRLVVGAASRCTVLTTVD